MPESVVEVLERDLTLAPVVAAPRTRQLVLSGGRQDEHHNRQHRPQSVLTQSVWDLTHIRTLREAVSFVSEEEEEVEVPLWQVFIQCAHQLLLSGQDVRKSTDGMSRRCSHVVLQ